MSAAGVRNTVLGLPLGEVPDGCEVAYVAMGCYWGAEQLYWEQTGVVNTAVGFMGGHVANPTYAQCCTGATGHAETVQLVFDPQRISYPRLLQLFWENHDPTTADRQGPDIGTQYRSAIFTTSDAQQAAALASREVYQRALTAANRGTITTTIAPAGDFYYAHAEHQQYLHKNPWRPSCHLGTGIACPLPDGFGQAPPIG